MNCSTFHTSFYSNEKQIQHYRQQCLRILEKWCWVSLHHLSVLLFGICFSKEVSPGI